MGHLVVQFISIFLIVIYLVFICRHKALWLFGIFIYSLSLLFTVFYLFADAFTGEGVTEAVFFHIFYGLEGVDIAVFVTYIFTAILFFVSLVMSVFAFFRIFRRCQRQGVNYKVAEFVSLASLGLFSVVFHPAALQSAQIASEMVESSGVSLAGELASFDLGDREGGRKNLVYIYVESLERTFLKESIFPGLAPNLVKLERESLHVEGIGQAPLTDWTIAGMVASQCGMPLATFKRDRNDFSDIDGFMPGTTCFGEVIEEAGYYSVFIGGADLEFAGKGRFYKEHGFDEVIGRAELVAGSKEALPISKWGVYDDVLLDSAYDKYKSLADAEKPFAMFVLTLDTHPPVGHKTPSCGNKVYGDGRSGVLNSVHCSDSLVAEFINKIEAYSSDNLVVVVASDHLQLRNDIFEFLATHQSQRENLFFARGEGITPRKVVRSATTLDIFPTLLYLMGWSNVEGAALGRNLLGSNPTMVEEYGRDDFYSSLQMWRMSLWESFSAAD